MNKHSSDNNRPKKRNRSHDLTTLRLYWRANTSHKGLFAATLATWVPGLVLQKLGLPLIAARALNVLIKHEAPISWQTFHGYILVFIIVAVVAQSLLGLGLLFLSRLEAVARPELQERVFAMLVNQSMRFHANNFSGSLVNQTNKFTAAYIALTDVFVLSIMQLTVNVILAIVVIAFFAWPVALAMLLWTICFSWLNVHLTRKRMFLSREAAVADSVLTAHLADSITNVSAIKAFGREDHEADTHQVKTQDRAAKKYASWVRAIQNDAVFGALMSLLQLMILVLSIYGVMHHQINIATLLLIQVYIAQIIGQLWGLSSLSRNIEQNLSDAGEMTELLHESIDVTDPVKPQKTAISKGHIRFKNVRFAHDGEDAALFADFNLDIKPGEKIGLVGHSGSGKTSLTRLLLRFSDVSDGSITIDGQDIRNVRQSELRQRIAYVPQEPLLFHRSLVDNIKYGDLQASREQVETAARQARADEFIEHLPMGYDTMVGERGVKLSGGQRQRIAIARAILKNAPILLLDEATSALDSESEKYIQAALKDLMQGRTAIVIAHRLSTIQTMDRIVVLDKGTIVEQGSHAELVAAKGAYAKLWAHQSGGFLED